jgi:hypothetical protein
MILVMGVALMCNGLYRRQFENRSILSMADRSAVKIPFFTLSFCV